MAGIISSLVREKDHYQPWPVAHSHLFFEKLTKNNLVNSFSNKLKINSSTHPHLLNPAVSKALKFRTVTLLTTLGITWLLTGNPVTSVGLTVIQQSTNTAVYYFFEQNQKADAKKVSMSAH